MASQIVRAPGEIEPFRAAFDRIRARGGIDDVFRRGALNARKRAG